MKIVLWTGRLQLHKSRFTTAQFDFTTAHLLINCTIKYALHYGLIVAVRPSLFSDGYRLRARGRRNLKALLRQVSKR